jgi:transcriptional regulator with XRE-family HTH domain
MDTAKKPTKTEVARKLRLVRQENELTQEEFAEAIGLSQPTVSRIEQGHAATTLLIILVLVIAFLESKGGIDAVKQTDRLTGKRLRKRREALGLSQVQLAKHLGVSRPSIARWELGVINISSYTWLALAMEELERRLQSEKVAA